MIATRRSEREHTGHTGLRDGVGLAGNRHHTAAREAARVRGHGEVHRAVGRAIRAGSDRDPRVGVQCRPLAGHRGEHGDGSRSAGRQERCGIGGQGVSAGAEHVHHGRDEGRVEQIRIGIRDPLFDGRVGELDRGGGERCPRLGREDCFDQHVGAGFKHLTGEHVQTQRHPHPPLREFACIHVRRRGVQVRRVDAAHGFDEGEQIRVKAQAEADRVFDPGRFQHHEHTVGLAPRHIHVRRTHDAQRAGLRDVEGHATDEDVSIAQGARIGGHGVADRAEAGSARRRGDGDPRVRVADRPTALIARRHGKRAVGRSKAMHHAGRSKDVGAGLRGLEDGVRLAGNDHHAGTRGEDRVGRDGISHVGVTIAAVAAGDGNPRVSVHHRPATENIRRDTDRSRLRPTAMRERVRTDDISAWRTGLAHLQDLVGNGHESSAAQHRRVRGHGVRERPAARAAGQRNGRDPTVGVDHIPDAAQRGDDRHRACFHGCAVLHQRRGQ